MHPVQRDFCILVHNSYFSMFFFFFFFFPSKSSWVRKVYGNLLEMQVPPNYWDSLHFIKIPQWFICLLKLLTDFWPVHLCPGMWTLRAPLLKFKAFSFVSQRWWETSGHHLSPINFCGVKDDLGASEPFGFKPGNWSLYNLFPHREDYFLDLIFFFWNGQNTLIKVWSLQAK